MILWESKKAFPWELIPFADWIFDPRVCWRQVTAVQSSDDQQMTYFWMQPLPGFASAYFVPNDGRKIYISRRRA